MKKFILTNHAKRRMQKRNITLHEVQQVLLFPDDDISLDSQKRKATKRMKHRSISVIYFETEDFYRIITVEFRRIRR
ncbi:MAG: DUF4258 domain-containing protein [Candidatus Poribacteria bacterium]